MRTTPEALPSLVSKETVAAFRKYKVLSKRELEARYEVFTEQYATLLNIESETAAALARTVLLPAAVRYLGQTHDSGVEELADELEPKVEALLVAIRKLEAANLAENQDDETPQKWAKYMRDVVVPLMAEAREVADRLEQLVADDLWPLPKYSEMLFIK
jgi:glutamine synthetase